MKPKGDNRMHQIKQIVKRILEIRNIFKTWSCSVLRRPLDKLYEGYFQSSLQTIQTLLQFTIQTVHLKMILTNLKLVKNLSTRAPAPTLTSQLN